MSTRVTEIINDNMTQLTISFEDENVNIIGVILVGGNADCALAYAPIFETDLRRNNKDVFPVPEPVIDPMIGGMN